MRLAIDMKRISALCIGLFSVASAFAQYGQTVTIMVAGVGNNNNNGNASSEVIVDGRSYYPNRNYDNNGNNNDGKWSNSSNSIVLNNLQAGQHSIVVNRFRDGNVKTGRVNSGNQPYASNFTVKPGYDLDILIKPNGEVGYRDKPTNNNVRRPDDRGRSWKKDRDNDDRNDDRWRNNSPGNVNGGYGNRYPNGSRNMNAMSDAAFNQVLSTVRGKWFQSGKVSALRDEFNNAGNYFSTLQARQLLSLISSETNRLDLAKASYRNIVDKYSFNQLYDLFSQTNQNELDRYVRSYRN